MRITTIAAAAALALTANIAVARDNYKLQEAQQFFHTQQS